ncbi:hypothetical protein PV325_002189 [Microctonus aethiopoides]|nr:hypothetical protein PV326_010296 [Microctonus aethiopoides]KAK0078692.1 hypothetical protein PV325_002189 [Microctonus aethiopoides]
MPIYAGVKQLFLHVTIQILYSPSSKIEFLHSIKPQKNRNRKAQTWQTEKGELHHSYMVVFDVVIVFPRLVGRQCDVDGRVVLDRKGEKRLQSSEDIEIYREDDDNNREN